MMGPDHNCSFDTNVDNVHISIFFLTDFYVKDILTYVLNS